MNTVDLPGVRWRRSRRSNGSGNCVEVAAIWRKSRRSNGQGACVEAATLGEGRRVAIRDSKDPAGPALVVSPTSWRSLTDHIKTGALG